MATIENRKQVVTQTLWTRPEANIATTRQRITSGNNLVWKFRPNIEVSKFPTAVRRKTKSCDPINPPRIVIHSLDAKFVLNICIPAKVSTVNVDANRNDVYDGRAMLKEFFSSCSFVLKTSGLPGDWETGSLSPCEDGSRWRLCRSGALCQH